VVTLDRRACRGKARRVVEFKIARSLEEWGDPYLDGDCPADYALQVMAQMVFSGIHGVADLMVMGPFFAAHTYQITYDQKVADWLIAECMDFWDSLAYDIPPPLDDSLSTYETVRMQHPDINTGEEVEIPEALHQDWRTARTECGTAERTLRGLKAKVLEAVGNAQKITVNGEVVAQRQPHGRGGVALVLKG
jgi:predicted phage-related endonuclease